MLEEVEGCKAVIKKHFNKPLVMTEVDEQHFKTMDGCHICGEKYTDKDVRVRDHCHITGKFRGSAQQECNFIFYLFFSIDNKKSIQGLILHKIGMIAVNMRYITAIDP